MLLLSNEKVSIGLDTTWLVFSINREPGV